ncbi:glycoside hydrolase [Aphanothece hegewaldii CCALA 016]|uniref:Glycoside hydrolase n=1 Tax=Aphanothece hegewaldii CCALA 016 TaxID=2107694 RepID=A0A2T1LXZ1_9CHRO|nr:C40 family peptidase [Aphanothece hegewaldii]PSF37255.1 glycoside hydrolase [Aphanothece hegewaldii CCALA 016]
MVLPIQFPPSTNGEYCCKTNLDLYNSSVCQELATQAAKGRHLKILADTITENAVQVQLCEDGYCAWLSFAQINALEPATTVYQAIAFSRREIENHLPNIIAFTKAANNIPNYYLWGGTIGPNYDCSGLIQSAFAHSGIWLPRDSYQQEAFTQRISRDELLAGDLIFFGIERVNHVALYLGYNHYIHSSGKEMGRNAIGIDELNSTKDPISQAYYKKLWSFGRVMTSLS